MVFAKPIIWLPLKRFEPSLAHFSAKFSLLILGKILLLLAKPFGTSDQPQVQQLNEDVQAPERGRLTGWQNLAPAPRVGNLLLTAVREFRAS